MENEKSSPKPLYLSKIQKKIQVKYEEMQKKIEKSRSIDSLQSLMDFNNSDEVYSTVKIDSLEKESDDIEPMKPKISVASLEEIKVHDAFFHEIDVCMKEEVVEKTKASQVNSFGDEESEIEVLNQEHDVNMTSVNSSNKHVEENNTSTPSPPKSPKISIRRRIGLKLLQSKEKRRSTAMDKERDKSNATEAKKESRKKIEKFILSNSTKQDIVSKVAKRVKTATVTIALIEAWGLEEDPDERSAKMIHCRFKFGTEKCKSKSTKSKDKKFTWMELLSLNMYDDNILEVYLTEKDTTLGRNTIDLSNLEKDRTHKMRVKLDELPDVELFFLLTITGTVLSVADIDEYESQHRNVARSNSIRDKDNENLVGHLTVVVLGAKGLSHHDCFCLVELDNERVQTHTEYKTADPNWMKTFEFAVNDITSILEITIQDEKRAEDVGKISISLLKINNGEQRWYALKDSTQRERAKGSNPRLLLEMNVTWHLVKASIRVITPKEAKLLQKQVKLDRHVFSRNLTRVRACVEWIYYAFVVVKTCFEWESRRMNVIGLSIWMVFLWFFRIWMLPLLLFIPFVWYLPNKYRLVNWRIHLTRVRLLEQVDLTKIPDKEEKTSLRRRIQSLQDMIMVVQEAIGKIASFGESVKNLFNFTVPYLSGLAIFLITAISLVLFLIPVQYTLMIWSMHKFLRKIVRPHRVPNNEIIDLLSRVPDDEILLDCEELPLEEEEEETKV